MGVRNLAPVAFPDTPLFDPLAWCLPALTLGLLSLVSLAQF
jgi:hypothetical protein